MAELYLSGPDSVTVTKSDDMPAEVFAEMADALAHVALAVSLRYVTLPLRDPYRWLWYFAEPASPYAFDHTLVEHLRHRVQEVGVRLDVLALPPRSRPRGQSDWRGSRTSASSGPSPAPNAGTSAGSSPLVVGQTSRCPERGRLG